MVAEDKSKEIIADFERFIRHEAMRVHCYQEDIKEIIKKLKI